jgi:hypothetical protein
MAAFDISKQRNQLLNVIYSPTASGYNDNKSERSVNKRKQVSLENTYLTSKPYKPTILGLDRLQVNNSNLKTEVINDGNSRSGTLLDNMSPLLFFNKWHSRRQS